MKVLKWLWNQLSTIWATIVCVSICIVCGFVFFAALVTFVHYTSVILARWN